LEYVCRRSEVPSDTFVAASGASAVKGTAIGATFGDSWMDLTCGLDDLGDLESAGGIG
jgi:hypothetical protein